MASSAARVRLATDATDFDAWLRRVAGAILRSAVDLAPAQRQFLWDVRRGRYVGQLDAIRALLECSSRCRVAADRVALAEGCRAHVIGLQPEVALPLAVAFRRETRQNGVTDVAQLAVLVEHTVAANQAAADALLTQIDESRLCVDALYAARPHPLVLVR